MNKSSYMALSYCVFNYGQARKIRQFIAIDKSFLTANQFSFPWLKLQNSSSGSY